MKKYREREFRFLVLLLSWQASAVWVASPASSSCSTCVFLQRQGLARQPAVVSSQQLHLLSQFLCTMPLVRHLSLSSFPWHLECTFLQAPKRQLQATSLLSVIYNCPPPQGLNLSLGLSISATRKVATSNLCYFYIF